MASAENLPASTPSDTTPRMAAQCRPRSTPQTDPPNFCCLVSASSSRGFPMRHSIEVISAARNGPQRAVTNLAGSSILFKFNKFHPCLSPSHSSNIYKIKKATQQKTSKGGWHPATVQVSQQQRCQKTSCDAAKSASQALEPKPSKRCWISASRCMGSDTWQVRQNWGSTSPWPFPSPEKSSMSWMFLDFGTPKQLGFD